MSVPLLPLLHHKPSLQRGVALLLGAVGALGFAPTFLWPALLFALSGIWFLLEQAIDHKTSLPKIFWLGWFFGLGYFTAGLYWVAHALTVDLASFWWLIPFALLGLPAILAIFTAVSFVLTSLWPYGGISRAFAFSAIWVATEWARGHLFTGFPWNLVGYTWGFSNEMSQLASFGGIYSLSLLTLLMAVSWGWVWSPPSTQSISRSRVGARVLSLMSVFLYTTEGESRWATPPEQTRRRVSLKRKIIFVSIYLIAGLVWIGGKERLTHEDLTPSTPLAIRLVQPNIPQTLKWDPLQREENFNKLLHLTAAPSSLPLKAIIWPESAVSFFLEQNPYPRILIAAALPRGALLFTGGLRRDTNNVWNSLLVLDDEGAIVSHYDKSHLVPFGEYLPFRKILDALFGKGTIKKLTAGGIDFAAGSGPQSLDLPQGFPAFSGLVCYEVIFPNAVVHPAQPRPGWIVNVTNDAWYGNTSGPYQHLESAHFRAIETGLPLVRAANSGVSAVFDGYGRSMGSLPLNKTEVLDVMLPPSTRSIPPYARWGDSIPWGLIAGLLGIACIL